MSLAQILIPNCLMPYAKSANEFLKKNRSRIESTLLFIGSVYAMSVMAIGSIAYFNFQESFTIFSIWFSNLGVGSTGWTFNQGLQGTAIFYSIMIIFLTARFSHAKLSTRIVSYLAAICGVIAVVGIWILTTNNMVDSNTLHNIGAYMYFIPTPFFTTLITVAMHLEKGASKRLWFTTLLLTFTSIIMAPLMSITANIIGIDLLDALGSMDPRFGASRFFEWASVLIFFIWIHIMAFDYRKFLNQKSDIIQ